MDVAKSYIAINYSKKGHLEPPCTPMVMYNHGLTPNVICKCYSGVTD